MYHQPSRNRADTLDYIHSMLGQLKMMAEAENCDMLVYLIDMAVIEAGEVARGEEQAGHRGRDPAA